MSRRLSILNWLLRHLARPLLLRTKTPEQAARDFDLAARLLFRRPAGLAFRSRTVPGPSRPLRMHTITCGPASKSGLIYYLHGGGFVAGSARTHRGMLGRLSNLSGIAVHALDYRLAQETTLPAALDDALAGWRALRTDGHSAEEIVLGGDSAGGGLALALLAELLSRGERPAGVVCFSPWTDLTLSGASLDLNADLDAILPRSRVEELVGIVLGPAAPDHPRISPLKADFPAPPPVYFQASRSEILLDDTLRMAGRLRATGGDVTVDLWEDAPHVWQIFDGWIPEARDALARAAVFARRCLKATVADGS